MKQGLKIVLSVLGAVFLILSLDTIAAQGNADVLNVEANENSNGTWTFRVSVEHPDTGWEDYADGWDVILPNGKVIKPNSTEAFTKTLWHPHIEEQPFTRSQSNIVIPPEVDSVTVRAHDIRDGFGGKTLTVNLKRPLHKKAHRKRR